MALQNFIDKITLVTAAWLNMVDVIATTIFQNATTNAGARTALFSDSPLEVTNGGTGSRDGGVASPSPISYTPSGDPQGALITFAGGSDITPTQGGLIRIGTHAAPLVNSGVNSAQFAISMIVDGTNAPGKAIQGYIVRNVSVDPAAVTYGLEIGNDQTGQELIFGGTSSTYAGTLLVGGPAGQVKFINVVNAISDVPLVLGTGGFATLVLLDNQITGLGPTSNVQVDMTPDKNTFLATLTGVSGLVQGTLTWIRNGNQVTLYNNGPAITGNSAGNTLGVSNLPPDIQPSNPRQLVCEAMEDNTVTGLIAGVSVAGNTLVFQKLNLATGAVSSTGWTPTGVTGIGAGWSITYAL